MKEIREQGLAALDNIFAQVQRRDELKRSPEKKAEQWIDKFLAHCEDHLYFRKEELRLAPERFWDSFDAKEFPIFFIEEMKRLCKLKAGIAVGKNFRIRISKFKIRDIRNIDTRHGTYDCRFLLR